MEFKSIKLVVKEDTSVVSLLDGDKVLGKLTILVGSQVEFSTEKEKIEKAVPPSSPPVDAAKEVDEALFGKDEDLPEIADDRRQPEYAPPLSVEFTPEEAFPKTNAEGSGVDNQLTVLDKVAQGRDYDNPVITEVTDAILDMSDADMEAALSEVEKQVARVKREIAKKEGKVVVTPSSEPFMFGTPVVTVEPAKSKVPDAPVKPVKKTTKKKK